MWFFRHLESHEGLFKPFVWFQVYCSGTMNGRPPWCTKVQVKYPLQWFWPYPPRKEIVYFYMLIGCRYTGIIWNIYKSRQEKKWGTKSIVGLIPKCWWTHKRLEAGKNRCLGTKSYKMLFTLKSLAMKMKMCI